MSVAPSVRQPASHSLYETMPNKEEEEEQLLLDPPKILERLITQSCAENNFVSLSNSLALGTRVAVRL